MTGQLTQSSAGPTQEFSTDSSSPLRYAVGDIDGNARADLVALIGADVRVFPGPNEGGNQGFGPQIGPTRRLDGVGEARSVGMTDSDGDGFDDIVALLDLTAGTSRVDTLFGGPSPNLDRRASTPEFSRSIVDRLRGPLLRAGPRS